ncbi:uncharacterized protein FOMMEDRAFT_149684 [Fomitiporia mediterranea MF3/22]|uniref:uncharacterized protein n=1 Tax=Fomitiporia mediterranea (strain MF3/22) TaxID=694068 RepID=UPI0004407DE0|nr:uncharacterized protein FOMMEDRAFT_149684 [Fomitiporia mediterranea MF3/22]EJD07186.1 hypothetical protein FOMMEDRAFT_149684 [Fomitiporia mediterranea MF3/22]
MQNHTGLVARIRMIYVEVEIPVSGKETCTKNQKVVVESSSKEDKDIPPDWAEGMVFHTPECVKCAERHKGPQGSTCQTVMDWLCYSNLMIVRIENQCTACIFRHSGCSLKGIWCKTRGQTAELHSTTWNLRSVIPPITRSEARTVCNLHSQMTKELNNLELQLMMMKNEFDAKIMALRWGINFLAMAAEASVDSGVEELE